MLNWPVDWVIEFKGIISIYTINSFNPVNASTRYMRAIGFAPPVEALLNMPAIRVEHYSVTISVHFWLTQSLRSPVYNS